MQTFSAKSSSTPGFLVVSLLIGLICGIVPVDLYAGYEGYNWTDFYYIWQAITAMVIGGVFGLSLGLILDRIVSIIESRRKLAVALWSSLIMIYFLYLLFEPAVRRARE